MKNSTSTTMTRDGLLVIVFVIACFVASQFLAGCGASRPLAAPPSAAEPPVPSRLPAADSSAGQPEAIAPAAPVLTPAPPAERPGLLRRAFSPKQLAPSYTVAAGVALPKNCKKCVVNVVHGIQTNVTAGKKAQVANGDDAAVVNTGKKSGPAVIKSDSVAQNVAGPNAQQTTTKGNNNHVDAKKQDTTVEPAGIGATIAKAIFTPIGGVLSLGLIALVLYVVFKPKRPLV